MKNTTLAFLIALGGSLSITPAQAQINQPNSMCNRININCKNAVARGDFASFDQCWQDYGAEHCPDWEPTIGGGGAYPIELPGPGGPIDGGCTGSRIC